MSRVYHGAYRVLLVADDGEGGEVYGFTEAAAYEDCERAVVLIGMGMPFERRRVKRARIVGPVHGAHPPLPGTDWAIEVIP
jgi:hypothetical protein